MLVLPAGTEMPEAHVPFHAATAKGWFMNCPTLFGSVRVKTFEVPAGLAEVQEHFLFNGVKLPAHILTQAHDFFRKVWNKQKTESSVYIVYNDMLDRFGIYVPLQYVTGTSVNHRLEPGEIRNGYRPIGTIHSHCNFGAFHSGTDKADMGKFPGLHITIGHVDRDDPELVYALSWKHDIFDIKRDQIIDEEIIVDRHGYSTAPDWWLNFVRVGAAPWGATGSTSHHTPPSTPANNATRLPHAAPGHWDRKQDKKTRNQNQRPEPQSADQYQMELDEWEDLAGMGIEAWRERRFKQTSNGADPFNLHLPEIEEMEDIMEVERLRLALLGFSMTWNIIHNEKQAAEIIANSGLLLPEEVKKP